MSTESGAEEPVPKLPRGRGFRFSGPELFRIVLTLMTLIGVILLARPCSDAVSGFVMDMDGSAAKPNVAKPGSVDVPQPQQYEELKPGMTEAELKAAIDRQRARAGSAAPGSAMAPGASTPGGSAAPSPSP